MIKRYTVSSGASHFPFFFNEDPPTDQYGQQTMVLYTDHIAEVCKLRDKLLSYAKECAECGGTGVMTIMAHPDSRLYSGVQISREVECPECLDIRELLGQ